MHTVAVCGTGYVGIVTAACLAYLGNDVVAYDTDLTKIARLNAGEIPLHEPGLREIVTSARGAGRLRFAASAREALVDREIVFIAVGTPVGPLGDADLTYVRQAAREIGAHGPDGLLVVNKSTVPVETADLVARLLAAAAPERRFLVASNPEFLREGSAVADFMHPDRIVIGTTEERAVSVLKDLYEPVDAPVLVVDPRTAEMIKYAANAFLAMKVSYVNELSNICDAVGANVDDVVRGIGLDRRIGRQYMQPGLGFGGSCLPKDVSALAHVARAHAIEPSLLDATLEVNRRQIMRCLAALERAHGDLDGSVAAVFGVSFKPDTDDVRESPALSLIAALHSRGARVRVHDPVALGAAASMLRDRAVAAASAMEAVDGADYVILATPWQSYLDLNWSDVYLRLRRPLVVDARNALDPRAMRTLGFSYLGLGRPAPIEVSA